MSVVLNTPWGSGEVRSRLLGRFDAQNLAACVGLLSPTAIRSIKCWPRWRKSAPATGRMDCIMRPDAPWWWWTRRTPDALEKRLPRSTKSTRKARACGVCSAAAATATKASAR